MSVHYESDPRRVAGHEALHVEPLEPRPDAGARLTEDPLDFWRGLALALGVMLPFWAVVAAVVWLAGGHR